MRATRHNPHAAYSADRHQRGAEGTGLEPVRACAQRFSRPPPYQLGLALDRKSTRLNSSHSQISYAVFCLKKKKKKKSKQPISSRSVFKDADTCSSNVSPM